MKNKKNEQGIDLIARSLARNLKLNSRAAKAEARRIRNLWHDALLRGEPVAVPGLELQIVWGQQKQQLQPVPTGLLKSNRKTPIRLVKPGNSVKVSYRSTVYFEFDNEGGQVPGSEPQGEMDARSLYARTEAFTEGQAGPEIGAADSAAWHCPRCRTAPHAAGGTR
jgi:hypothetical protein